MLQFESVTDRVQCGLCYRMLIQQQMLAKGGIKTTGEMNLMLDCVEIIEFPLPMRVPRENKLLFSLLSYQSY